MQGIEEYGVGVHHHLLAVSYIVTCGQYGHILSLSQPHSTPPLRLVPNYTSWWQRHLHVNNLSGVPDKQHGSREFWTRDPLTTSPTSLAPRLATLAAKSGPPQCHLPRQLKDISDSTLSGALSALEVLCDYAQYKSTFTFTWVWPHLRIALTSECQRLAIIRDREKRLAIVCRDSFENADIEVLQRIELDVFAQLVLDDELHLVVMMNLEKSEMDVELPVAGRLHHDFSVVFTNLIRGKVYMWTVICYSQ